MSEKKVVVSQFSQSSSTHNLGTSMRVVIQVELAKLLNVPIP
jgi:hypothetical protein